MARVTEAVVRRAGHADLAALAWLRREWTREQDGDGGDPGVRGKVRGLVGPGGVPPGHLAGRGGPPPGRDDEPGRVRADAPARPGPEPLGPPGNVFVLAPYRDQGLGGQLGSGAPGSRASTISAARVAPSPSERAIPLPDECGGFGPPDTACLDTRPAVNAGPLR